MSFLHRMQWYYLVTSCIKLKIFYPRPSLQPENILRPFYSKANIFWFCPNESETVHKMLLIVFCWFEILYSLPVSDSNIVPSGTDHHAFTWYLQYQKCNMIIFGITEQSKSYCSPLYFCSCLCSPIGFDIFF